MGVKKVNIPAPRAREEIPDNVNGNQLDLGAPQAAQPPAAPRAKRYGGRTVAKSVTIESATLSPHGQGRHWRAPRCCRATRRAVRCKRPGPRPLSAE